MPRCPIGARHHLYLPPRPLAVSRSRPRPVLPLDARWAWVPEQSRAGTWFAYGRTLQCFFHICLCVTRSGGRDFPIHRYLPLNEMYSSAPVFEHPGYSTADVPRAKTCLILWLFSGRSSLPNSGATQHPDSTHAAKSSATLRRQSTPSPSKSGSPYTTKRESAKRRRCINMGLPLYSILHETEKTARAERGN